MSKPTSKAWLALNAKYLTPDTLCGYGCGRIADTGDHIIPTARGGTDTEDNYMPACRQCNGKKQAGPPPRAAIRTPEHEARRFKHKKDRQL